MSTNQISNIAIAAICESPFNPRKTFSDAALQELTDSIKSQGVMSPIVVRPSTPPTPWEYEIVFGHRRYRATERAGLEFIPAIVRAMSDEEAAVAQVHENLQREDVSPMEEADSFEQLRTKYSMTGDAIAKAVGKTKAYVYGRLKLVAAAPLVRKAIVEEGLSPEIALRIARLGNPALQTHALRAVRDPRLLPGQVGVPDPWLSTRMANEALRGLFQLRLEAAPFDQASAELLTSAGACTSCPKRAGNIEGLGDLLAKDTCTDATCHGAKVEAHQRAAVEAKRAAGHPVIEGEAAQDFMPQRWSAPDGYIRISNAWQKVPAVEGRDAMLFNEAIELLGERAPKTTVVKHDGAHEPIELITTNQAREICRALGVVSSDDDDEESSTPGSAAQAAAEREEAFQASMTPAQRACFDSAAWTQARKAILWGISSTPRTGFDLRRIARWTLDAAGEFTEEVLAALGIRATMDEASAAAHAQDEEFDPTAWLERWIDEAPIDDVGALVTAEAVSDMLGRWPLHGHDDRALELANHRVAIAGDYGVDLAEFVETPAEEPTVEEVIDEGAGGAPRARRPRSSPRVDQSKPQEQRDDAGDAGDLEQAPERDPNTNDMFEGQDS